MLIHFKYLLLIESWDAKNVSTRIKHFAARDLAQLGKTGFMQGNNKKLYPGDTRHFIITPTLKLLTIFFVCQFYYWFSVKTFLMFEVSRKKKF